MFVIREVLNCKPGQVRAMVEKFKIIAKAAQEIGPTNVRIHTDVSGEPFWTLVAEIEVESIDAFFALEHKLTTNPEVGNAMADYHEFVVSGRREIFRAM